MLTTAGLSLAARSTKSGSVWALATWPLSGVSVQNCTSEAEPAAGKRVSAADTATAGKNRISLNCICNRRRRRDLPGRLSSQFNVFHTKIEEYRFDQSIFVRIEIATGFLPQHSNYIDQLLRRLQILAARARNRIGDLAQRRQRLGRETYHESGEGNFGFRRMLWLGTSPWWGGRSLGRGRSGRCRGFFRALGLGLAFSGEAPPVLNRKALVLFFRCHGSPAKR